MKTTLINSINFTESDYNVLLVNDSDLASFDEFIDSIVATVEDNNGTLEDAIEIAEDAFFNLS